MGKVCGGLRLFRLDREAVLARKEVETTGQLTGIRFRVEQ